MQTKLGQYSIKSMPTEYKCPCCNNKLLFQSMKNDIVDDHKYVCSNFECDYERF